MKIKNIIRMAFLGGVVYAIYRCTDTEKHDYTEIYFPDEPEEPAEEKNSFREKLEADLKEAEARYQD